MAESVPSWGQPNSVPGEDSWEEADALALPTPVAGEADHGVDAAAEE